MTLSTVLSHAIVRRMRPQPRMSCSYICDVTVIWRRYTHVPMSPSSTGSPRSLAMSPSSSASHPNMAMSSFLGSVDIRARIPHPGHPSVGSFLAPRLSMTRSSHHRSHSQPWLSMTRSIFFRAVIHPHPLVHPVDLFRAVIRPHSLVHRSNLICAVIHHHPPVHPSISFAPRFTITHSSIRRSLSRGDSPSPTRPSRRSLSRRDSPHSLCCPASDSIAAPPRRAP